MGEGPGEQEDQTGLPFQGRAGEILNLALRSAGLDRAEVFSTNVVRCRCTNALGYNRAPTAQEVGYCRGYLEDELDTLPERRVIVALGASAVLGVLGAAAPSGGVLENQGKVFWSERYQCWVVITLHPAYIARKPGELMWLVSDIEKASAIAETGQPPRESVVPHEECLTVGAVEALRDRLREAKWYWDWETNGLHPTRAVGFCAAFSIDGAFAWVVPRYGAGLTPVWSRSELRQVDDLLRDIFTCPTSEKGGHHVAFDATITRSTLGAWPVNVTRCTMIGHHLLNNHLAERAHGLKRLSELHTPFGRYDEPLDRWLVENGYTREGKPDMGYAWRAPDHLIRPYNATDAAATALLDAYLEPRLREANLWEVYIEERVPFALACGEMDREGMRMSRAGLTTLSADLAEASEAVDRELERLLGRKLNANSPQQVSKFLFEERGLPVLARTDTGAPSTAEEVLVQLAAAEPVSVPLILHRRAYTKLKGTFVDGKHGSGGILLAIDPDDRARMGTLLHVTETFRLASRRPFAYHTFPRPLPFWSCPEHGKFARLVELGPMKFPACCPGAKRVRVSIRALVIADEGHVLLQADFRQQEFVLAAIISGQADMEEAMLDRDEDAHAFVMFLMGGRSKGEFLDAAGAFHDAAAEAEYKNLRSRWKSVNFMILYRGGSTKLGKTIKVSTEEAQTYIDDYYERLDRIRWWQYETIKGLRSTGKVFTPFRTYRTLPGIWSPNKYDQYEAERQGCNAPIQISGYHVMARGVLRLRARWQAKHFPGRVAFTVHDEVNAMVREDLWEEGAHDMRECLEAPHPELVGGCGIPRGVKVDIAKGTAWGEGAPVELALPATV